MIKFEAKTILLLILLGVLLVAVNYFGFDKSIKNTFFSLTSPMQRFFWERGESLNSFFGTIGEISSFKKINDELKLKNQALEAKIARLEDLRTENQDLRTALGLGLEKEFQLIMAETTAKDALEDTLFINKGSKDGIKTGNPVITPEKSLVGRIQEVLPNFSRVMLISNPESSFDAKTEGGPEAIGVVKGKGSLRAVFDLIPQDKKVEIGDQLVTTSLGGVFPKGILIGEIMGVSYSDIKPFQVAQIKTAFQINNLSTLFVIIGLK